VARVSLIGEAIRWQRTSVPGGGVFEGFCVKMGVD
jgi:hypothetical protein